jgi:cytochrome c556
MILRARPRPAAAILATIGFSLICGAAVAQAPSMADAVKQRHDNFKAMSRNFKAASDQLKTASPDLGVIKNAAAEVKGYSTQLPTWFPKGSGPETGLKMEAKAAIWTDSQDFSSAAHNFQIEAAKLSTLTAASNDLAAIRAQFKATGQACGACHDKYRVKDD